MQMCSYNESKKLFIAILDKIISNDKYSLCIIIKRLLNQVTF